MATGPAHVETCFLGGNSDKNKNIQVVSEGEKLNYFSRHWTVRELFFDNELYIRIMVHEDKPWINISTYMFYSVYRKIHSIRITRYSTVQTDLCTKTIFLFLLILCRNHVVILSPQHPTDLVPSNTFLILKLKYELKRRSDAITTGLTVSGCIESTLKKTVWNSH